MDDSLAPACLPILSPGRSHFSRQASRHRRRLASSRRPTARPSDAPLQARAAVRATFALCGGGWCGGGWLRDPKCRRQVSSVLLERPVSCGTVLRCTPSNSIGLTIPHGANRAASTLRKSSSRRTLECFQPCLPCQTRCNMETIPSISLCSRRAGIFKDAASDQMARTDHCVRAILLTPRRVVYVQATDRHSGHCRVRIQLKYSTTPRRKKAHVIIYIPLSSHAQTASRWPPKIVAIVLFPWSH